MGMCKLTMHCVVPSSSLEFYTTDLTDTLDLWLE